MRALLGAVFAVAIGLSSGACAEVPPGAAGLSHGGDGREAKEGHGDGKGGEEIEEHHVLPTDLATIARAEKVKILETRNLECPMEALGPVDVHEKMESTQAALHVLKLRAAALGADAVTGVEFEHGEGSGAPTHLAGMAVRCRDLLHGRNYDVLGEVSVRGKMGQEEEAFDALRRKAATMNANMVLGIKFEHGEADGEGPTLTGTAIRVKE
jgi:uncharacterized protein YbjQ (UPF0145 family)